ncbi:MAG: thioredoxin domain-containing protein [Pseudomonadales bacterium]
MRTQHLDANGKPQYTNRLKQESSPYLQQHAHNPVDWYPWGDAAFDAARTQNKPVFLSIGYSTCHWCHVMEDESFDNVEIANLLNEHFISIKVDREEHPDIDAIYMNAVQLLSGRGGWPMSSFLTAEGKPFFAGTYYPPQQFKALLEQVASVWRDKKERLVADAEKITAQLRDMNVFAPAKQTIDEQQLRLAVNTILAQQDTQRGGTKGAPKFPQEPQLLFMLNQYAVSLKQNAQVEQLKTALLTTLDNMARGGIYDQVGGGFHRYSTDPNWLVPHFEKMLYNQAYLARAYAWAGDLLGREDFSRVSREVCDYVLRDMQSQEGLFYSATDADSEGEEGVFFVWSIDEINKVLGDDDARRVIELYGMQNPGNFEGHNILYLPESVEDFATRKAIPAQDLHAWLADMKDKLYKNREQREHPLRDEKVITAWNSMMIRALSETGQRLHELRYQQAAEKAATELWQRMASEQGLHRILVDGKVSVAAKLEDYVYMIDAMLAVYDLTQSKLWLNRALQLQQQQDSTFLDPDGGYVNSSKKHKGPLISNTRELTDGALPSPNAIALQNVVQLYRRTGDLRWRNKAQQLFQVFRPLADKVPNAVLSALLAWSELQEGEWQKTQYGAGGIVRATAKATSYNGNSDLTIAVHIAKGWHVNAAEAAEGLVATAVQATQKDTKLHSVEYPEAARMKEGLSVLEGKFEIKAQVQRIVPAIVGLRVQACDANTCLEPETLNFVI